MNSYYTAAVKSMLQSYHNFFYASFDPGGFVTVDKPPVAFWIQTIFAKIVGFHGWSVILPQALAGIGSVVLLYILTKRSFGKIAGRITALTMALTPIVPAVSRTNNIDSLLVFTLLLAAWMLFRSVRTNNAGWLFGAFAVIGIGFNMKMLQAYMVVPGFLVYYILAAKINWKKKAGFLTSAIAVMLAISLSWAVIVDMTPADKRPYIGSSQTNSVLELAFGYNGVSRLTGQAAPGAGNHGIQKQMPAQMQKNVSSSTNSSKQNQASGNKASLGNAMMQPPGGNGQSGMNGPDGSQSGMFNTGTPGLFRLFQKGLADQISWLLPFALFSTVGLLAGLKLKGPYTIKQKEALFWAAWLVPVGVFFSIAGFFHQYYLIMLAPPIAAFVGAGTVALWKMYREKDGWKAWLLPGGILSTSLLQMYIMSFFTDSIGKIPMILVGGLGIGVTLVLSLTKKREARFSRITGIAAMIILLAMPAFWSMTPILYGENSAIPAAGPSSTGGGMPQGMMSKNGMPQIPGGSANNQQSRMPGASANNGQPQMPSVPANSGQSQMTSKSQNSGRSQGHNPQGGQMEQNVNEKLVKFLTKNNDGAKYLFATTSANSAAPYIIQTGKPVMAMGGFLGTDPILTVNKLKELVKKGEVKYFLIGGIGGSSDLTEWIKNNGKAVPSIEWQSGSNSQQQQGGMGGSMVLYEVSLK